jgi:MFS family permease
VAEPAGHAPPSAPSRRAAYWALGLLTAINLLNYLDRYVIAPLGTDLKRDMGLSDTQLGWLIPVFILVYMAAAPLFGAWGDRGSRARPIALGIGIWSVATVLSGLAHGYPHLLARALVGIGEAAIVAIAPRSSGTCSRRACARVFRPVQHGHSGRRGARLCGGRPGGGSISAGGRPSSSRDSGRRAGARLAVAARSAAGRPGE